MREQLYRSPINRVFGGVCSGLGIYFNLDPVLVRVIFVLLAFFKGIGILLYIILWIVLPERYPQAYQTPYNENKPSEKNGEESNSADTTYTAPTSNGKNLIGYILIGLGVLFFSERFLPYYTFEDIVPLLFIIIGAALIWNSKSKVNIK